MPRGSSLADDLKLALNNARYSDLKIFCEDTGDGEPLYGCRAILGTRSETFDRLLFEDPKEDEIKLLKIKTASMKVILEYLYTGSISNDALNIQDITETYYAADYFMLSDLLETILSFVKQNLPENDVDLAASLLSAVAAKMDPSLDNKLFKLLSRRVAGTPLNEISYDKLNASSLEVILKQTLKAHDEFFATSEYGVVRYIVLWAAYQISQDAVTYFKSRMPPPEKIDQVISQPHPDEEENEVDPQLKQYQSFINDTLSQIIRHINLQLIHADILANVIEPLHIIPDDKLLKAYRYHSMHPVLHANKRGLPFFRWETVEIGQNLVISESDSVVEAPQNVGIHESARTKELITGTGVYEWDIVIEENCGYAWIGVSGAEGVDYSVFLGGQAGGWVVGSSGVAYHENKSSPYGLEFEKGTIVTAHLDMSKRTLAFSFNGDRHPTAFTDLPPKLYPAVSLNTPGRFRIKPHV